MRNKKEISYKEDILREAKYICDDFSIFTSGYRVLFLIHRNKEGGETNNTKAEKIITSEEKEYFDTVCYLLDLKNKSEIPYRIYASVNERDFEKAIRIYKTEQLDADYYDIESRHSFYKNTKNRFIGSLMKPNARKSSYFLIDLDNQEETEEALMKLAYADLNNKIIKQYGTKNGTHIITEPFNPNYLGKIATKINKDGLLLLKY